MDTDDCDVCPGTEAPHVILDCCSGASGSRRHCCCCEMYWRFLSRSVSDSACFSSNISFVFPKWATNDGEETFLFYDHFAQQTVSMKTGTGWKLLTVCFSNHRDPAEWQRGRQDTRSHDGQWRCCRGEFMFKIEEMAFVSDAWVTAGWELEDVSSCWITRVSTSQQIHMKINLIFHIFIIYLDNIVSSVSVKTVPSPCLDLSTAPT